MSQLFNLIDPLATRDGRQALKFISEQDAKARLWDAGGFR